MKLKKTIYYDVWDHKKSVMIYYLVVILLLAFGFIMLLGLGADGTMVNGMEIASVIFIFVVGLNSFKESFYMMVQNGVSRKTLLRGRLISFLVLCFGMGIIDQVILQLVNTIQSHFDNLLFYGGIYVNVYQKHVELINKLQMNMECMIFNILLYLLAAVCGYLITILYYRMNKQLKITVSVGVPAIIFILLPVIDTFLDSKIEKFVFKGLDFSLGISSGEPYRAMLTFLAAIILATGLNKLLIYKVTVKNS